MRIDYPTRDQTGQLKRLWKEAFSDDDGFLDCFFGGVFAPERCRCVMEGDRIVAALYWLNCQWAGETVAYLYAVATAKDSRGRGICRDLMADTHALLAHRGYAGSLLVPGTPALFGFYGRMGYEVCSGVDRWEAVAAGTPMKLRPVSAAEYAALRRRYLPEGGVLQEGENLKLLEATAEPYAGEKVLLCATRQGDMLICPELLGDRQAAPRILAALGCARGTFRGPGNGWDFAMYRPITAENAPKYFGLAFD